MEKKIMNFCGCEVVLRCVVEDKELQSKYMEIAEREIKEIFRKEFDPTKRELQEIVEKDLGVKKHWLWGWIKPIF